MVQLMPLPLIVFCFSKIQIGFTFLVPAHLGSPGKSAVKRVCVCVFGGTQCMCVLKQDSAADTGDVIVEEEEEESGSSYTSAAEDATAADDSSISQLIARREQLSKQVAEQVF